MMEISSRSHGYRWGRDDQGEEKTKIMDRISNTGRRARWGAGLLLVLTAGCGAPGDEVVVDKTRVTAQVRRAVIPDADGAMRFQGKGLMPSREESQPQMAAGELPIEWDVPSGWVELPSSQMRQVNLRPAGDVEAECYLSILPGDAGGLVANVNRWRGQMGQAPLTATEVGELPKRPLLGQPATLVTVEGNFTGMGGEVLADAGMRGAILSLPEITIFIKMTGPVEVVQDEAAHFDAFCDSVRMREGLAPDDQTPGGGSNANASGGSLPRDAEGLQLDWTVPSGWTEEAPGSFQVASFRSGESGETKGSISVLLAAGGGLADNVNRWRGQMGLEPWDKTQLANLPKHPVLGGDAWLVELEGAFRGMGSEPKAGWAMLGLIRQLPGDAVFLKLTGPKEEVAAERDAFLALASSLVEL